jgi:hypothetical protein
MVMNRILPETRYLVIYFNLLIFYIAPGDTVF